VKDPHLLSQGSLLLQYCHNFIMIEAAKVATIHRNQVVADCNLCSLRWASLVDLDNVVAVDDNAEQLIRRVLQDAEPLQTSTAIPGGPRAHDT
jgi:hypothetical protein